ncbi:hypothetical protein GCM10009804_57360 [Kribbella hippodromi]|uniref:DUF2076 domain-containing protein n=1 Tax=Kribbella hippodromi TaxID=434347 RepID=A0ABN2E396_9ACTN
MTEFVIFVVVMIVVSLITKARQKSTRPNGQPNPKMQALIERLQAQQGLNQPPQQHQGQYTQPAAPQQQPGGYAPPAQYQPAQYQPAPYQQPLQYQQPVQYQQQPPAHVPPQNNLPRPQQDLDAQVRALMQAGNEVGAIRLLSDERDLGILEAQTYARSLVAPKTTPASTSSTATTAAEDSEQDDTRYIGSAAISESIFNLDDRDENVWASGWVDKPEPDDRSDIDELWQTVGNPPRPGTTPPSSQ